MKQLLCFTFFIFGFFIATGQVVDSVSNWIDNTQIKSNIFEVEAYPNPFSVKTTISFQSDVYQEVYFEIKNVLGKSVYKQKLNAESGENKFEVFRDDLPVGMYLYTLKSETGIVSKRLVIR